MKDENALIAGNLKQQAVSVTRRMAAALPDLREIAEKKGLKIHHLGAGYPHPEVTDPQSFLVHKQAYYDKLARAEGMNDTSATPEFLREAFAYTDTLGPKAPRQMFASVYGADWGFKIDADSLIPTVGATGGISLVCSLFERADQPLAYLTDAPTYAGFLARATLKQSSRIFSVDMDEQGPLPDQFLAQIHKARNAGYLMPLYYTVPDGHNPAGISFSAARREEILDIARQEKLLILEDAPYLYISYTASEQRPEPFIAMDPRQTVHLFTGSKIGFPGPRVGFIYSDAHIAIDEGESVPISSLLLTESSADILFQNPESLRSFEALLHDEQLNPRKSLWSVADTKLSVYRENRQILLDCLQAELGAYPEQFSWTVPGAGFFSVFTFLNKRVRTDEALVSQLVSEYGVVVVPMSEFYPEDARLRDAGAGFSQIRLSFCFTESLPGMRAEDLREAVMAFCKAAKAISDTA
ncbi:MAG: aminotransferase class I/II-fold pyridoxal phosphate-dependent enzyme [Pseudomonadales bacterium]|nr:aminotransferase class I/II-fold pyridoxal phosphate-dependent enzyme [Pseudomonadales bacterium]